MVAAWLINAFPGPFLPNTIVFKEMKPDWEAEFDDEIQMYSRLSSLQGSVVPVFYGVGLRCDNRRRGLVFSDVGGRQLGGVSYSEYGFDTLKSMVRESLAAIYRLGLSPCDANPVNCLVVGDRVVIVDHEQDEELDERRAGVRRGAVDRRKDRWGHGAALGMPRTEGAEGSSGAARGSRGFRGEVCGSNAW